MEALIYIITFWFIGLLTFIWIKGTTGDEVPIIYALTCAVFWPLFFVYGIFIVFLSRRAK